jgi:hypothetical protein
MKTPKNTAEQKMTLNQHEEIPTWIIPPISSAAQV